jgi:biopolymer transport protein ExbD
MAGGGGESEYEVNVNLTALLDVLTNLLFFLMLGFAAQQTSIELETPVELPVSTAEMPPKKAINVTIGKKELKVEKETITTIANNKLGIADIPRIEPLYRKLVALRDQRVIADKESEDVLFIICDKDASYQLLRKVMMTGAEAGFPKFRMAVMME